MENNVQINVGVKEVGGSVKSIRQELREAQQNAVQMARSFGENSTQATEAAKRVAKLRDEIEDVGIKIKGLNPDKFQRIASIGQGVAQGFVAAQGAMALFGSESKELEKTMVKLQGAIALSQGLQGLKDLKLALSGVSVYVKIFAVAIAGIVAYWKQFSEAVTAVVPGFQKVIDFFKDFKAYAMGAVAGVIESFKVLGDIIKDVFTLNWDQLGKDWSEGGKRIADASTKAFQEQREISALEASIKQRKFMADLMAAEGKDVLNMRLKLHQDELKLLEKGSEEYNAKLIEIASVRKSIRDRDIEAAKKAEEARLKAFDDAQKKIVEDSKFNDEQDKQRAEERAKWNEEQRKKAVEEEQQLQAEVKRLQDQADADQKKRDADKLEAEKQYNELRVQAAVVGINSLSDIYSAFAGQSERQQRKAFEVQKAANIATTTIDTFTAAQSAYKAQMAIPTPDATIRATIAAGIAIASGLARLAKIKATSFGTVSTPTNETTFSAPQINTNTAQQVNQQRQIQGSATGLSSQNQVTKVVVVETDITRAQGRVNDIRRRALVH